MKLYAYSQNAYYELRDLSEQELLAHHKFTLIFIEARNRLQLFRMLKINYDEWQEYIRSLLSAKTPDHDSEMLNLDRLLLNYLACSYTIQEHFKVSFQRRFRKNSDKQTEFSEFERKLFKGSWAFAFFTDFRGYVQHYGLGIREYARKITKTSVNLNISCNSTLLLKDGYKWERSKLTSEKGELNLVDLLEEYHVRMLQDYGTFIANFFSPELTDVEQFYSKLTQEVRTKYPTMRMIFIEQTKTETIGVKTTFQMNGIEFVPNDVFAELGISHT